jgi:hypothetical protein
VYASRATRYVYLSPFGLATEVGAGMVNFSIFPWDSSGRNGSSSMHAVIFLLFSCSQLPLAWIDVLPAVADVCLGPYYEQHCPILDFYFHTWLCYNN